MFLGYIFRNLYKMLFLFCFWKKKEKKKIKKGGGGYIYMVVGNMFCLVFFLCVVWCGMGFCGM